MPYANPERQREANAEHMRRQRAADCGTPRGTVGPLLSQDVRVKTAGDILSVLEGQVRAVLADEALGTVERARVLATLAGVSLRAIEAADLASRVEAIEDVLNDRAKVLSR
jgi:hypothetical protein